VAETLAQELSARRFERAVFLGSNELQSLAAESALKMLELTDGNTVAVSQSVLGFRHGPKTIVNGKTLVVVFVSNDAYTRSYDLDLVRELVTDARSGALVVLGSGNVRGAKPADFKLLEIAELQGASDVELALVAVVFAQTLALRQSRQFGLTPDNPNASGVVSRVVKGVTIHPWTPGGGDVPGS
jgi:tagatose-6-phosphate ketose/aldose isomerase